MVGCCGKGFWVTVNTPYGELFNLCVYSSGELKIFLGCKTKWRESTKLATFKFNSIHVFAFTRDQIYFAQSHIQVGKTNSSVHWKSLFCSPGLALTTIVLSLNWLVVDFCYYGLSLHSGFGGWNSFVCAWKDFRHNVSSKLFRTLTMQLSVNLAGDIFLNFVLSAAVEVTNRSIVVDWKILL